MSNYCPQCGNKNRMTAKYCKKCGAALTVAMRFLQSGQMVRSGDYRIVRPLGKGGMGVVYLAENLGAFGRLCVIKEMLDYYDPSDPRQVANAKKRFEDEARILARLRHPGIPEIQQFFSERNRNYIVMEYVEGNALDTNITRYDEHRNRIQGHRLPSDTVAKYGIEVCEILRYLTELQPPVIHHDIKPANIIIDQHTGNARLVDFGTAKAQLTAQPGGRVGLQKSSVYGTEGYAPPEQYQGKSDSRSDVYALAATMYHLLTDDDPRDHPFTFPKLYSLPLNLDTVLRKALEQDVSKRLTATEFQRELKNPSPNHSSRSSRLGKKLGKRESFALLASLGVSDSLRTPVTQYLATKLAISRIQAEIRTWQDPGSIATGLDERKAMMMENDLRQMGIKLRRIRTSQVLSWRVGIPDGDTGLETNGEVRVELQQLPLDRVCHCYHCDNEWTTQAQIFRTLPRRCRQCGSEHWSRHRIFQCASCGHQFATGDMHKQAKALFKACPACGSKAWHPDMQPRLTQTHLQTDIGSVLTGQTLMAMIKLPVASSGTYLRGRVISAHTWLNVQQAVFRGDSFKIAVNSQRLATKQQHTGQISVICSGGALRVDVVVYVDEPPRLHIDVNRLDFGTLQAQEKRQRQIVISNAGGQSLQGKVTGVPSWLQVDKMKLGGDQTILKIHTKGCDLPSAGTNYANLTIKSNGGTVSLTVTASAKPTTLAVEPASLDFGFKARGKDLVLPLRLENLGFGALSGRVISQTPWLQAQPENFSGNNVHINVMARTAQFIRGGDFSAHLDVVSNGGRQQVPVRMQLSPHSWPVHMLRYERKAQVGALALVLIVLLMSAAAFLSPQQMHVTDIAWYLQEPGALIVIDGDVYQADASFSNQTMQLIRADIQPTALTISTDGALSAWNTSGGDVELWRESENEVTRNRFGFYIVDLNFAESNNLLHVLTADGRFGWLDLATTSYDQIGAHPNPVAASAYSALGHWLAISDGDSIDVYRTDDGVRWLHLVLAGPVTALAIASDGREIAWGTQAGAVYRYRPSDDVALMVTNGSGKAVQQIAYDLGGEKMAWARANGDVTVQWIDEETAKSTRIERGVVLSLAFNEDGRQLAIGTSSGLVLWPMP